MNLDNKTIVFQGDSITDMSRGRNAWDQNHIYGHSYVFLLASKLGYERPKRNIKIFNRGVTSEDCKQMYARWQEDAIDLNPDIISILIGINDIHKHVVFGTDASVEEYEKTLCTLIEETKSKLPDVKLVICEPFGFPDVMEEDRRMGFATEIPKYQSAAKRTAEKYDCIFVELQEEFEKCYNENRELGRAYWIWDGVHPTAQGQIIIAKKWLKCVEEN